MLKRNDVKDKKRRFNDNTIPNLTEGLIALQTGTSEYCTPGHRMGHGYGLLISGLTGGHHPRGGTISMTLQNRTYPPSVLH